MGFFFSAERRRFFAGSVGVDEEEDEEEGEKVEVEASDVDEAEEGVEEVAVEEVEVVEGEGWERAYRPAACVLLAAGGFNMPNSPWGTWGFEDEDNVGVEDELVGEEEEDEDEDEDME